MANIEALQLEIDAIKQSLLNYNALIKNSIVERSELHGISVQLLVMSMGYQQL